MKCQTSNLQHKTTCHYTKTDGIKNKPYNLQFQNSKMLKQRPPFNSIESLYCKKTASYQGNIQIN